LKEKRGVLLEDLEQIASNSAIPWEKFKDSTILITGATGLIGSALVRSMSYVSRRNKLNVRILAYGRNEMLAENLTVDYGAEFFTHDILQPLHIDGGVDYIFHCAAVTKSSEMVSNPTEVIETSVFGTTNVLNIAREKSVKSMVYMSSMEVYGATDPSLESVAEEHLGYLDLGNTRGCYPQSKRQCECMCACWSAQYGVPVKIARLSQTFGAGTPRDDSRVFAQFVRSGLAGENIVLHTEGRSQGNYCYISDAVTGILLILFKGENGEAYNVVNPAATMTVRNMAEMVANRVFDGKISAVVNIPDDIQNRGYAADTTMKLSAEKLKRLGWAPKYGLEDMFRRMIRHFDDSNQPEVL